tara:strand:- start:7505 stop:7669 length:165 start_codon:yes stop_codon:yes gene_type:complete
MKNLELNEMENVQGGFNWENCVRSGGMMSLVGMWGGPITYFGAMAAGCVVGGLS